MNKKNTMDTPSSKLHAAIRALHGESDLDTAYPALSDWIMAQVIAFAPTAHPLVRDVAALRCNLPAMVNPPTLSHSALHDIIPKLIGTHEGWEALRSLARIVPARWGAAYADMLVAAVRNDTSLASIAAVLIGPCDTSVALLRSAHLIEIAVRRWGESSPDEPTAWMDELSAGERDRMLNTLWNAPRSVARCIPWMPPDGTNHACIENEIGTALDAFADASPTARARHADLLQRLIEQAQPDDLDALTRLACAMMSEEAWARVATLVQKSPDAAYHIVAVAPWNALQETVRTAIMERANQSIVCAAITAAQGQPVDPFITSLSAAAFFAALDPNVWDAYDDVTKRRWRDALESRPVHLAVRSLGPHPAFLAKAHLDNDLVHAAQRHTLDDAALRWALLPVALHNATIGAINELVATLPMPPDPGAFFCIAGGKDDPASIAPARAALHTPADLALAVALQHCGKRRPSIAYCSAELQHALCGRSWDQPAPIVPLLDRDAHDAIIPNTDALVERLTHPDRRDTLRRTLERLATLPPKIAIPIHVALTQAAPWNDIEPADVITDMLRDHGDVFVALTNALKDDYLGYLGSALLPLPDNAGAAHALRTLARDDPPFAHRLAHAFRRRDWRAATETVLTLSAQERDALTPAPDALVERLAHPDRRDALRHALDRLASLPPDVNLLVRFALDMGTMGANYESIDAAEDSARALRGHGDVFLSMVDALEDDLRTALLPLPEHAALAHALHALASDDPPTAQRLAYALRSRDRRDALLALLDASPHHAENVWRALNDVDRRELVAEVATWRSDDHSIVSRYPIIALALAAIQSDDLDLHHSGIAALEARPDIVRVIWMELSQATQQSLLTHPSFASAIADLPQTHNISARQRFRCR